MQNYLGGYTMDKDLFGFEKAIQLDHLTKEQIDELIKILNE
jgi:hypothetical protein